MLCLISPAKKLNKADDIADIGKVSEGKGFLRSFERLKFSQETKQLVETLQQISAGGISKLMSVSSDIANLNYSRYQDFDRLEPYPAIYYFAGDVYKSLDSKSLPAAAVNNHIAILSGLYGLLQPFDYIKAYRLEMGTSIQVADKPNLYRFWQDKITDYINEKLSEHKYLANLASIEYFKSVNKKKLIRPIINFKFLQNKNGTLRNIAIMAKRARGYMARYIVENNISDIADLEGFSYDNYRFSFENSDIENEQEKLYSYIRD